MDTEKSDDVVVKLKKVKDLISTFRQKLEDDVIEEKNLYFVDCQETNEKVHFDSLIPEKKSIMKEQFIQNASSSPHMALEKDAGNIKADNDSYIFNESSSPKIVNSKYCIPSEVTKVVKKEQNKKLRTAFSQQLENFAKPSAKANGIFAPNHGVVEESFNIEMKSEGDSVTDRILVKNSNGSNKFYSSETLANEEEVQSDKLIMVEIYRRIANFFEIGLITPIAMIIENHLEVFEFGLAIIVCTIYMFYSNAKKNISKRLSNKTKEKSSRSKSDIPLMESEFSTGTSCQPIKKSDSSEPLIILGSNNNSKEELNIPREAELYKNENNSSKHTLTVSKSPDYKKRSDSNYEVNKCNDKMLDLDEFDSLLIEKWKSHQIDSNNEIKEEAKESIASLNINMNAERSDKNVEAGDYFSDISGLYLKIELANESTNEIQNEIVILESPQEDIFVDKLPFKNMNAPMNEKELHVFGKQAQSSFRPCSIDEKVGEIEINENRFNISDVSQLSNSFSVENRLLDIDETLFEHEINTNLKYIETEPDFEENYPTFMNNIKQDICSNNSKTIYDSIDTSLYSNENSGAKQRSLESPMSFLEDYSDILNSYNKPIENDFEVTPNENKQTLQNESSCNEFGSKNDPKISFGTVTTNNVSTFGNQDNNKVIPLVLEKTSSNQSLDKLDLNNAAHDTEKICESTYMSSLPGDILGSKIMFEYEKGILDLTDSFAGDLNNLSLCNEKVEKDFETNTKEDKETVENKKFCLETIFKDKTSTLSDISIFENQENNKVIPLVPESSIYLDFNKLDSNNTNNSNERYENLNKSTEELIFINEPKLIACEAHSFEVGDRNFDNILSNDINYKEIENSKASNDIDLDSAFTSKAFHAEDCSFEKILQNDTESNTIDNSENSNDLELDKIHSTIPTNDSSQQSSNDDSSKYIDFPVDNFLEATGLSSENSTGRNEITVSSENDPIQECKAIVTTDSNITEKFSDEENLNLTPIETKNVSLNKIEEIKNDKESNVYYPVYTISQSEIDDSEAGEENEVQILQYSQEVDGPLECQEYKKSSEDNFLLSPKEMSEDISLSHDILMESTSPNKTPITQEKYSDFHKPFSSSMPDVRDIDVDELVSCKMNISLNNPTNEFPPADLDSSEQELLKPLCSNNLRPLISQSCFQNLPRIYRSISKRNSNKDPNQDIQGLPSHTSEAFETDIPSLSTCSKNAIAAFASEVRADRKKHKKQRSFRSKMSSMFNGVRRFRGRMLTAPEKIGNYKKQKDD